MDAHESRSSTPAGQQEMSAVKAHTSEEQLLTDAVRGDSTALDRLLVHYYFDLHEYVARRVGGKLTPHVDPDDIVQQTFLAVFKEIKGFPVGKRSFAAWILRIANNRLVDTARWYGREKRGGGHHFEPGHWGGQSSVDYMLGWVQGNTAAPDVKPRRDEARCALQIGLAKLNGDQRRVLYAHFFQHQSVNDIAEEMGRTPGAVRELMRRGQENLRKTMGRASEWLTSH